MMGPKDHNRPVGDSAVRRTGFSNFGRFNQSPQHNNPHPKGKSNSSGSRDTALKRGGY